MVIAASAVVRSTGPGLASSAIANSTRLILRHNNVKSGRGNAQVNPRRFRGDLVDATSRQRGRISSSPQRTKRPIQLTSDVYCKGYLMFPTGKN